MKKLALIGLLLVMVSCDKNKELVEEGTGTVSFGSNYGLLNCIIESEVFVDGELIGSIPGSCDSVFDCAGDATLNHELSEGEHSFEIILSDQDGSCFADTTGEFTVGTDECLTIHFDISNKIEIPVIEEKASFLIVGDTSNNLTYKQYLNADTIISNIPNGWHRVEYYHFMISPTDTLTFYIYYQDSMGGELDTKYTHVSSSTNVEIAMDTSRIKYEYIEYDYKKSLAITPINWKTPIKLDLGDTISEHLFWSDTTLRLSFYDDYGIGYRQFKGWSDCEPHYLGFRVIDADTILGWIKISNCYFKDNYIYESLTY